MGVETPGRLFVVATPIGHLGDITLRAIQTLKEVDLIAAEDTRHTNKLLIKYGVRTGQVSYHEHNEVKSGHTLLDQLKKGRSIALVSDAGTPLINDPGERLVSSALEAGIPVMTVPGPCAAIAALSIAGLPTEQFTFKGFVPSASSARLKWIRQLTHQKETVVFYESPHRIVKTIESLCETLPQQRRIAVARELTKQYETCWTGTLEALAKDHGEGLIKAKGEFALVLEGAESFLRRTELVQSHSSEDLSEEETEWLTILVEKLTKKEAAALLAKKTGKPKRHYYQWLVDND